MLVDSHCHLDFPDLIIQLPQLMERMAQADVGWALVAGVSLERLPAMFDCVHRYANLFAAVGVHPDRPAEHEPDVATLVELAKDERVVAIGETGLDYYRAEGDLNWQRARFRNHIAAARQCALPLIIHTRAAAEDTLRLLDEEGGQAAGGVFHCFTESEEVARRALDMGFYISFSGIVTFRNAQALKNVARFVPLDCLLIETDSPYLAPMPHRGKTNEPAYVRHVAEEIAQLRGQSLEIIAEASSANFFRLFPRAQLWRAKQESACRV